MPEGYQLWLTVADDATQRFFLVPRGLRLPPGALAVRSLSLGLQQVEPEDIAPFEVTATEAQAHVDAGWSTLVGNVRDAARRVVGESAERLPDPASWLGITPGQAVVDPEKRREGGRSLLSRVGKMMGRPLAEAELDRVEDQIQGARDTLVEHGGRLVRSFEQAADAAVGAVQGRTAQPPDDTEEAP